jgi:hypothetical protein
MSGTPELQASELLSTNTPSAEWFQDGRCIMSSAREWLTETSPALLFN